MYYTITIDEVEGQTRYTFLDRYGRCIIRALNKAGRDTVKSYLDESI